MPPTPQAHSFAVWPFSDSVSLCLRLSVSVRARGGAGSWVRVRASHVPTGLPVPPAPCRAQLQDFKGAGEHAEAVGEHCKGKKSPLPDQHAMCIVARPCDRLGVN